MTADDLVSIAPVSASTWRQCAALRPAPGQEEMVSPVVHSLCLCAYGGQWSPWAITQGVQVVGFAMTAVDDDASRWIGGVLVDAAAQRQGVARAALAQLRDRLAAEPGCPNVALSYTHDNAAARALYAGLGFFETGETRETEDDGAEVVARWHPPA